MNDLRMELKVCEGCGVLWLRACHDGPVTTNAPSTNAGHPHHALTVYCRTCVRKLATIRESRVPRGHRTQRVRLRTQPPIQPANDPVVVVAGGAR